MSQADIYNPIDTIKLVFSQKKTIFVTIIVFVICAALYNTIAEPKYLTKTTFIVTQEDDTAGLSGALGQYSSFLKSSPLQDMSNTLFTLIESNRIQYYVAEKFMPRLGDDRKDVLSELQLENIFFTQTSTQLYVLKYEHKDASVAYETLLAYIDGLSHLNKTLEISAKQQLITVIDPPEMPEDPGKPRKLLNLILSVFLGFFTGIASILLKNAYKHIKD